MKPTIGRIVHYVSRGSSDGIHAPRHVPMIVVDSADTGTGSITGWTFNPYGLRFEVGVRHDEQHSLGTWHWPEREDFENAVK